MPKFLPSLYENAQQSRHQKDRASKKCEESSKWKCEEMRRPPPWHERLPVLAVGGLGACGAAQDGRVRAARWGWALAEISGRMSRRLERRGPTCRLLIVEAHTCAHHQARLWRSGAVPESAPDSPT